MKELTIEEKAKLYDEAYKKVAVRFGSNVADEIFPELKESEDEKIRKELIKFVKVNISDEERYIAWLEKQGEKPQGKSALEAVKEEKVDNANKIEPKDYNSIDPHFGKPIDKVEPKFHEGDWAVYNDNGDICQIKSIRDNKYCLWPLDSNIKGYLEIIDVDNEYHLWDITKDAKDGDVLVNGSNIFIFHFINDTRLMGYCHVNTDNGRFYDDLGKNECFCLIDAIVNPATKEQRDTLERAINNAGYIWYAGKKKLKKIIFPHFKIGDTIAKKRNSNIRDFGLFTITDVTDDKYWYNGRIICDITEQDDWELL